MGKISTKVFDLSTACLVAIMAGLLCLVGICIMLRHFNDGIKLDQEMLEKIFYIPADTVKDFYQYLNDYNDAFLLLASATCVACIVVLFIVYLNTNEKGHRNALWDHCEGTLKILIFQLIVLFIFILWIWMYYSVDRINQLFGWGNKDCYLRKIVNGPPSFCAIEKNRYNLEFNRPWFPQNTDVLNTICAERLRSLCVDYILKAYPHFRLSSIGCVLNIIGTAALFASLAAILPYSTAREQMDDDGEIESSRSTISIRSDRA